MAASDLRARLGRAFLMQAAYISVAAIIGVFLASVLFERLLIRQALQSEAAHFWQQRERDPGFPLPATLNLTGYLDAAPAALAGLAPGFHDARDDDDETVVYVGDRDGRRLYLVFDRSGVGRLATALRPVRRHFRPAAARMQRRKPWKGETGPATAFFVQTYVYNSQQSP